MLMHTSPPRPFVAGIWSASSFSPDASMPTGYAAADAPVAYGLACRPLDDAFDKSCYAAGYDTANDFSMATYDSTTLQPITTARNTHIHGTTQAGVGSYAMYLRLCRCGGTGWYGTLSDGSGLSESLVGFGFGVQTLSVSGLGLPGFDWVASGAVAAPFPAGTNAAPYIDAAADASAIINVAVHSGSQLLLMSNDAQGNVALRSTVPLRGYGQLPGESDAVASLRVAVFQDLAIEPRPAADYGQPVYLTAALLNSSTLQLCVGSCSMGVLHVHVAACAEVAVMRAEVAVMAVLHAGRAGTRQEIASATRCSRCPRLLGPTGAPCRSTAPAHMRGQQKCARAQAGL